MQGRIVKAVFSVAGIIFISRLLGFFREMVIADKFGTSAGYDLYLIAIILPALFYGVINFSSIYLFVPYLSKKENTKNIADNSSVWYSIWPVINSVLILAVCFVILIILFAPYIMKIWSKNFTAQEFHLVVFYCRITAFVVILGVLESFMRAYLNVKKIFTYPASGYIVYNIFFILAVLVLYKRFSVGALVVGLLGGLIIQDIYLFLRIISFNPLKRFNKTIFSQETKSVLATGGILILIEFINRSYFLVDRYVAQKFGEGVISALNYSQVLIQLPDSIIGFAIGTVIFPLLSEAVVNVNNQRFTETFKKAIISSILLSIPIAVFFFINATELVYLLFHRGAFDQRSVMITASVLKPFTPSIIALFVISLSIRACYSRGWGRYVLYFAIIILITKFVTTLLLPRWLGYIGITTATAVAHIGFASLMLSLIVKRIFKKDKAKFLVIIGKLILIGVLTAFFMTFVNKELAVYLTRSDRLDILFKLFLSGITLLFIYIFSLYIFGLKNVMLFTGISKNRR